MKTIQKLIQVMHSAEKGNEKFSLSKAEDSLLLSRQGAIDLFNYGTDKKFFIETSDSSWLLAEDLTTKFENSLKFKDNSFEIYIKPLDKFYKKVFRHDEVNYFSEPEIISIFEGDPKSAIFLITKQLLHDYKFVTLPDTSDIYVFHKGVFLLIGIKVISQKVQEYLKAKNSIHTTTEVIGHVKRSSFLDRKDFLKNQPAHLICLKNGIFNLKTYTLEDFDSDLVFLAKISASFDSKAKCPNILKFLSQIVSEKDIPILQEFAGYCLLRSMPFHKALMLVGVGSNGKSTYINLLKNFLGVENCAAVSMQQLEIDKFSTYGLFGKLANLFADLPSMSLRYTSKFKLSTGGDLIPAERKFKDLFYFVNHAKFIFSANQVPKVYEDSDAFFRRWILINFPNTFTDKTANPKIMDSLTTPEELSGFLNFCLEGLARLFKQKKFSFSATTDEIRQDYIRKSDSVGAFQMDFILMSPDSFVQKKELYISYTEYCRKNQYPISSEITFHKNLLAHIKVEDFRPVLSGRRVSCWKGIKLKDEKTETKEEEIEVEHVE